MELPDTTVARAPCPAHLDDTLYWVRRIHYEAKAEVAADPAKHSQGTLRRTAKAIQKTTGVGSDNVELNMVAELPDEALLALSDFLHECTLSVTWPSCSAYTLLHRIGNKVGTRTIATLPPATDYT